MLLDTLEWEEGQDKPIDSIRFPYQMFSDHLISRFLLRRFLDVSSKKTIKNSLFKDAYLGSLFKTENVMYSSSGIIEALIIEFPTRIRNKGELFDYLNTEKISWPLIDAFINGLIWRDPKFINDSTGKWTSRILQHDHYKNKMLDTLVALAAKPNHPYNSNKLNRFLKKMDMNKRALFWSEFLRKQYHHGSVYRILSWIETSKVLNISKVYAQMYVTILMWILTSTDRSLRDRATRAIYFIGCKFPDILFEKTIEAMEINDLYVKERMIAASYGISMALQNKRYLQKRDMNNFALKIFRLMFKKGAKYSTTHILTRDYARLIVKLALLHKPDLLSEKDQQRIEPPFKDGGIRRWGRSKDKNKNEYSDGNYLFGFHFNNYTIGYLLPKRNNYDFDDPEYIRVKSNMWWRIYKLGYSLEDFGEKDKEIANAQINRSDYESNGKKD